MGQEEAPWYFEAEVSRYQGKNSPLNAVVTLNPSVYLTVSSQQGPEIFVDSAKDLAEIEFFIAVHHEFEDKQTIREDRLQTIASLMNSNSNSGRAYIVIEGAL